MKKTSFLLSFALIMGMIYLLYNDWKQKTAWVDISKVYDSFQLRKDLENKFIQFGTVQKQILDSLELETRIAAKKANLEDKFLLDFERNKAIYLERKANFEQQVQELRISYDKQVMTQLKSLSKKYGIENHYSMIHGLDDSGIFLFGDPNKEITNEVIEFINQAYKDEK